MAGEPIPLPWPLLPDATRPQTVEELARKAQENFDALARHGGSQGPTSWTAVTFQNGWGDFNAAVFNAAAYRAVGGQVFIRGCVAGGVVGVGTPIFTLPATLRPTREHGWAANNGAGGVVDLRVQVNGFVTVNAGAAFAFLDVISFFLD